MREVTHRVHKHVRNNLPRSEIGTCEIVTRQRIT
jgi:hypothetical protein